GITGNLIYASDLFERPTIERIVGHFQTLLSAMVADESQRIQELPLLTPAQRHQVLVEWNATQRPYADRPVHQLFEAQAAAQPDATALVYQGEPVSYHQLNTQANQLAHYLLSLGIRPDDRVALCVERGPDMLVGLLGILKAGGAYVPLDPEYPEARLTFMLTDCAPVALLTQDTLADRLPAMSMLRLVVLDDRHTQALIARHPANNLDPQALGLTTSHLAYVMYTSGSTGTPKGVAITHRNVAKLALDRRWRDGSQERVLLHSPQAFDASTYETWVPLANGGQIVIAPPGKTDISLLAALIQQHSVTGLWLTAPLFHLMVQEHRECFAQVRCVIAGGVVVQPAAVSHLLERYSQITIVNGYGPTETTTFATNYPIRAPYQAGASVPIGAPLDNTQTYVLNTALQPAPVGVPGELYIGGDGLARGYLNREELTQERFIPNPFSPGERLYRTGDRVRWLPQGVLEYLGRTDQQVKLRGFRIELGEIEAQLLACRGVREAVVIARNDTPGDWSRGSGDVPSGEKRLVAYLVPEEDAELSVAPLRAQLAAVLADYMIPAAFVTLSSLPLTPNGKLDRNALPAPEGDAFLKRAYEAPSGEIEIAIAGMWQELLHVDQIGRHDHFFELGGHSLLAVQLVARLRQVLGVDVSLRDLFAAPTLAALVKHIAAATALVLPPIQPADRTQPLPLSWAQQRLWFLAQLDSAASAAYHMPATFELQGALDRAALHTALDRIVARHEVLRTRFVKTADGTPVQIIAPPDVGFALSFQDLTGLAEDAQRATIAQSSEEQFQRPFDLSAGPLIRGQLLQLADDRHILLFCQHHIISDGWSIGILVQEIAALYTAFARALPDPLSPLSLQYADYAVWQRQWLQGEALHTQIEFWR